MDALSELAAATATSSSNNDMNNIPEENSLEREEAAGGPVMPLAGQAGAATRTEMDPEQANLSNIGGGGPVGDAAMAVVDDRIVEEDVQTNGYSKESSSKMDMNTGETVNDDADNSKPLVPPMSFDVDQPAQEVESASELQQPVEPAPGQQEVLPNPASSQTLNDPSLPPSQESASMPASNHIPQQPVMSLSSILSSDQPSQPSPDALTAPPTATQPAPPLTMDALPDAPAPLPSQLVNHTAPTTDYGQTSGAVPEEQQQPPQQPSISTSADASAAPSAYQSTNGGDHHQELLHPEPIPQTHTDQIVPSAISPSLQKRPFEPDNSIQSIPYQGDSIEPTLKKQKISPAPEGEQDPQLLNSAESDPFPKTEEVENSTQQQSNNQFSDQFNLNQQESQQLDHFQQPGQSSSSSSYFQSDAQQQQLGEYSMQNQNNHDQDQQQFDGDTSAYIDQSMIDQSLDNQAPPHDGMLQTQSPSQFDGQGEPSSTLDPSQQQQPQESQQGQEQQQQQPPLESPAGPIPKEQQKYGLAILRTLKKKSEAAPFLQPVDPVALGIPHYPQIITQPMDLGTVERKLQANSYFSVDDFFNDMRLIWRNCIKFNGPENPISGWANTLSTVFEKQAAKMPTLESIAAAKRSASPADNKKGGGGGGSKKGRRSSTTGGPRLSSSLKGGGYNDDYDDYPPSTGNSMRSSTGNMGGASLKKKGKGSSMGMSGGGLGGSMGPGGMGSAGMGGMAMHQMQQQQMHIINQMNQYQNGGGSDINMQQLKFCKEVIKELFKKIHQPYVYPFYDPVDYVALGIPDYPKVIRRPMDLGSMKRKLDANQYPSASAFENDFKLLINNCFTYNPPMTPVHKMGEQTQAVFYDKWSQMPRDEGMWGNGGGGGYGGGYDEYDDGESEQMNLMQRQLELLNNNLEMMRAKARMKANRQQSYGGPSNNGMSMSMAPSQMQLQQSIPPSQMMVNPHHQQQHQHQPYQQASSPPPSLPIQKPPRPPPAPRERKPPAPKRKSDTAYAPSSSTTLTQSQPPKPRSTKSSARARGDNDWMPSPRGVGSNGGKGESDYEEEEETVEATVTFEMKRELAEKIQEFDGSKLDKVVEIIRSSAPDLLGDDNKEIELDIDMLDQRTLLKLYEYVVRPVGKGRQLKPKKNKVKGRNRGVDEVAEEERINLLQAQLDAMEGGNGNNGGAAAGGASAGNGINLNSLPAMPTPAGMMLDGLNNLPTPGGNPAGAGGRGDVASSSSEDDDDEASDSGSDAFAPEE